MISALRLLVADVLALYLKTKSCHWHVRGPHFRDYHLLFDEQADQLLHIVDAAAERARTLGGEVVHSIGEVAKLARIAGNAPPPVEPEAMLEELERDNGELVAHLRALHDAADQAADRATASLVESWIDEGERRMWMLRSSRR